MFKVGDEVYVKGEIADAHEGIERPYFVAPNPHSINWVSEDKICPADKTYSQGLADAWELLKKVYDMTCNDIEEIFDVEGGFWDVIRGFTYEEALAKIEAYEREKEIKVGDVVTTSRHGATGVVVKLIADDRVNVLYGTGYVDGCYRKADCVKTGKHIDIEGLLRQIGE